MATNLAIDDKLITDAVIVGHHSSKKAAVTAALKEYIQRHKQIEILNLFNSIEYDKTYDYKQQRNKE
jgi:Arc/MetJ family transcription regulator